MVNGKLWLSPGARIGFALTACVVALLVIFVAIPFYAQRADEQAKEQRAAITKEIQKKATTEFLHTFDCSYGAGLKLAVREAADNERRVAAVALTSINSARALHDEILKTLKPLDGVRPC
jgi:uncharacterized membrane protein YhiD involved in acid resistance